MGRRWAVAGAVLASSCGALGGLSDPKAFTGTWQLQGGPTVTCPSGAGVLTVIDDFTIVEGANYPLVLTIHKETPVCALELSVINLTATLRPNQRCTLPVEGTTADVTFTRGELGGSSDHNHLNVDLRGTVTVRGESCTYSLGGFSIR